MNQRRILVIEDDNGIRQGVADALSFAGYDVLQEGDGRRGLEAALGCDCDLVLLDLVLPNVEGLEILREVRVSRPTLPVIVLTAKSQEADRVAGLRLGADDYVVKPFSVRELLARVQAVLRRSPERPTDMAQLHIPGGCVHLAAGEVAYDDGGRQELTPRECELLRYLAGAAGRAVSRDEILSRVWRVDPLNIDTRTIDMAVARIREKLRDDADAPRTLLTVRGKGYMLRSLDGE